MSTAENAIVVISQRAGEIVEPVLVIVAFSGISHEVGTVMREGLNAFRGEHPGTPPILVVSAQDGAWAVSQTDIPGGTALAESIRELVPA